MSLLLLPVAMHKAISKTGRWSIQREIPKGTGAGCLHLLKGELLLIMA